MSYRKRPRPSVSTESEWLLWKPAKRRAKDIEAAAQAAVDIAADIMKEAQQLTSEIRENGRKISEHVARSVSTAIRDTRAEVLNPSEPLLKNSKRRLSWVIYLRLLRAVQTATFLRISADHVGRAGAIRLHA